MFCVGFFLSLSLSFCFIRADIYLRNASTDNFIHFKRPTYISHSHRSYFVFVCVCVCERCAPRPQNFIFILLFVLAIVPSHFIFRQSKRPNCRFRQQPQQQQREKTNYFRVYYMMRYRRASEKRTIRPKCPNITTK